MSFLTHYAERAGSRRRLSIVSVVGLVLVPFVIAGVLVWALWNPQERLDTLSAAVVNNDKPVTLNGQTVPLGRELAAGLVGTAKPGSKKAGENFAWAITDAKDASSGLHSGKYTAVITIPKDFSANATSTADAAKAQKATIGVKTSDSSKVLDQTISQTIAQTAAATIGSSLTKAYLDNVYVGFNTLGDKLGEASSGADQLAQSGPDLTSGLQAEASGQQQLADGLTPLASGASTLASGVGGLASGVQQLSDGAQPLATGAQQTATGAKQLSDGTAQLSQGAQQLATGLKQLDDQTAPIAQLGAALPGASGVVGAVSALQPAIQQCAANASSPACTTVIQTLAGVTGQFTGDQLAQLAAGLKSAASQSGQLSQLPAAVSKLSDGAGTLASGVQQSASGASGVASGTAQLASGTGSLASGLSQTAAGAQQLSDGASSLATGTQQTASAAGSLASAGSQLASAGAHYADGTTKLASGLDEAVKSIPSYSEADRKKLASVVATPVTITGAATASFGTLAAPIFGVLALWLGAIACFVVLRPVTVLALGSPRSSLTVALRGLVVPGVVGIVQGAAVAGALQPLLQLAVGPWFGLAGIGALAGVAFAAVNQALVALFGGTGRFISMFVILLGLATGLVGTAPKFMTTITDFTPIAPAQHLVSAVVQGTALPVGSIVELALWLLGAILVTTLAVARGRMLPAAKLAPRALPAGPSASAVASRPA
ncbi:MAG TPA: YhgE/Pip domain-containing protein [Gryllotalpicola sp.]